MLILIDAFQPEGITKIVQDSVFMMPHLGVLSTVQPKVAMEILEKDCLVHLGTCIAPKGILKEEEESVLNMKIVSSDDKIIEEEFMIGDLKRINIPTGKIVTVVLTPEKNFDVGLGIGRPVSTTIEGGEVGIIVDVRGRPIIFPSDKERIKENAIKWYKDLDMYPKYKN